MFVLIAGNWNKPGVTGLLEGTPKSKCSDTGVADAVKTGESERIALFAVTGDNEAIVDGTVDAGAGREYTHSLEREQI